MAILNVKQVNAGRNLKAGSDFNRAYTVVWRAIVDDPKDGPATFGVSPLFPARFAPYVGYENTSDVLALCRDFNAEPWDANEWRVWKITATFSTNFQAGNQKDNPEDEPPVFWIETEFTSAPEDHMGVGTKDANDTFICNSAGVPYKDIQKIRCIETWIWEKNHNSLNRAFWTSYQNTINSDQFYEIAPKCGLLHIIVPKASYRNGQPFWRVQYRIKVNKAKWTIAPLDYGNAVLSVNGELERPVDQNNQPIDGEVRLDGHGKRLVNGPSVVLPERDLYVPMPFSGLGL